MDPLTAINPITDCTLDTVLVLRLCEWTLHGPGVTDSLRGCHTKKSLKTMRRENLDTCAGSDELYTSLAQNATPENILTSMLEE